MVLKSFFKLLAGTFAVQLITLLFYPVLARIYSPSDFGTFGVVSSLSVVLGVFVSGQYHMAFPQLNEKSVEGKILFKAAVIFSFSAFLLVFLLSASNFFNSLLSIKIEFWVVPLFTFSYCMNEIMKMWLIFLRKYSISSWYVSLNRLVSNLLKTIFPLSLGLVFSEIITNVIFFIGYLKISSFEISVTIRPIYKTLKKYSFYPLFYSLGAFAQGLQQEIPVFMFKRMFSDEVVGFYVMANKFTVQSILVVSSALVLVLANSQGDDKKSLGNRLITCTKIILPISVLCHFFLLYLGEDIFLLILGKNWGKLGEISAYLSLLIYPKLLFVPLYAQILKNGEVKLISILRIFQIFFLMLIFLLIKGEDFIFYLKSYVVFDFVSDILITLICYKKLGFRS